MRAFARVLVVGLLLSVCARPAGAAPIVLSNLTTPGAFSFGSAFDNDNDVAHLFFDVLTAGTVFQAETTSYRSGGFDLTIGLFDSNDNVVLYEDPADPGAIYRAVSQDIDQFDNLDDILTVTLGPGTYRLAIWQWGNDMLDDRFSFSGDGLAPGLINPDFVDWLGNTRNTTFAVQGTLTEPSPSSVPEPGTLTLLGLGVAGAALRKTRRRSRP